MPKGTVVVVVSLSIAVAGVGWGYAQQRKAAAMLTPLDYIEIQQLYANYSHALDKGLVDGFIAQCGRGPFRSRCRRIRRCRSRPEDLG
jgi:hypothetical protein